jgi:hypothetical protein
VKVDETTKDQEDHNADLKAAIQYGRSQQNPTMIRDQGDPKNVRSPNGMKSRPQLQALEPQFCSCKRCGVAK